MHFNESHAPSGPPKGYLPKQRAQKDIYGKHIEIFWKYTENYIENTEVCDIRDMQYK